MGLAIEVGMLADLLDDDADGAEYFRDSLAIVNEVLRHNGLPSHVEPENVPEMENRASILGYPYSFLHYLRRFAAHAWQIPDWKPAPFPETSTAAEDPLIEDEAALLRSHLICHSDCEGFYVPIDFAKPLISDDHDIPGGLIGSSQGLVHELKAVAPLLGIKLVGPTGMILSDAEASRINDIVESEGLFWIEHAVWISLFEAARLSIEYKCVICFT